MAIIALGLQKLFPRIFHVKICVLQALLLFTAPMGLWCTYVGFFLSK